MALLEKHLTVKKSTLPGAGKGLFTKVLIPKGTRIIEYKGKVMTWAEVEKMADDRNGYVFYFSRNYVIDGWKTKKGIAHLANDANGIGRIPGVKNNSEYVTEKRRCFVVATKEIPAGSEILVGYGAEYWQAIRYNIRQEQKDQEKSKKKNGKVNLPHHDANKKKRKVKSKK